MNGINFAGTRNRRLDVSPHIVAESGVGWDFISGFEVDKVKHLQHKAWSKF